MGPLLSALPPASTNDDWRDLDADAESESAARRGVLRGGDSDRVSTMLARSEDRKFVNAFETGRVSILFTSTAIVDNEDERFDVVVDGKAAIPDKCRIWEVGVPP